MNSREAELEETVRQLRTALYIEPERVKIDRLQQAFRIGRFPAMILAALYDAGSTWLPPERLDMMLPETGRGLDTIKVHVCTIRSAIDSDAVLNMRGAGYTLGAPGVLACKRVLSEAGAVA